jgi:hypothetical protein
MRGPNSEADVTGRWPAHRFRCRIRTLMAPVAVVAGALAYCEMQRRGRTISSPAKVGGPSARSVSPSVTSKRSRLVDRPSEPPC